MTERLDCIEAILLVVAERQNRITQQQEQNTRDIDALVEGISNDGRYFKGTFISKGTFGWLHQFFWLTKASLRDRRRCIAVQTHD